MEGKGTERTACSELEAKESASTVRKDDVIVLTRHSPSYLAFHYGNQVYAVLLVHAAESLMEDAKNASYEPVVKSIVEDVHCRQGRFVRVDTSNKNIPLLLGYTCSVMAEDKVMPLVHGNLEQVHRNMCSKLKASEPELNGTNFTVLQKGESQHSSQKQVDRQPKRRILTEQVIERAIPEDGSSIMHIFGRRINFDFHPPDASLYSLVRSWVQDDPYRIHLPRPGADLSEYVSQRGLTVKKAQVSEMQPSKAPPTPSICDVLGRLRNVNEAPSIDELREQLVRHARKLRRKAKTKFKRKEEAALASLRSRGISIE